MCGFSQFLAALFLVQHPLRVLSASSCYYPDGTFQHFDYPCYPDQAVSICCAKGHTCMSNNLCRWPDSEMPFPLAYIRGSCTDPSWNSTYCGGTCKTVSPHTLAKIVACPGAEFCCELDDNNPESCCNLTNISSHPIFTLDAATTVTVIGVTSASSATALLSSSTVTTTVYGGGGSQTSPTPAPTNGDTGNGGMGAGTPVGIGVGVGAGVLLVCALVFYLWQKRRTSTSSPEMDNAGMAMPGMAKPELATNEYNRHRSTAIRDPTNNDFPTVAFHPELGTSYRRQELPG